MKERWAPCKDIERYEASSEGNIRNTKSGRIMKKSVDKHGYETVCLHEYGKQYTKKVHRLVAEAFTDEDISELDVTHRDHDRQNNRLDNLVVRTRQEIIADTYLNGRKQTHKMRPIQCVETGEVFESIVEAARVMGLSRQAISTRLNKMSIKTKDGLHFVTIN